MKYRDRTEIHAQILQACSKKPKRITDILIDIRLLSGCYSSYIRYLESKGLLAKNGKEYTITEKGRQWLKHYQTLKQLEEE